MNKMRNIRVEIDGIKFQSKKEAKRYQDLKLLEKAGEIFNLKYEDVYEIVNGKFTKTGIPIKYKPDFVYVDYKGNIIVEDVKGRKAGTQYRLFLLKKALMKERYNIDVIEI